MENRKMSMMNTIDLSLRELGEISLPDGTDSDSFIRRRGVTLIWSLLPDLDVYVLNVFSEKKNIFWNFAQYERLCASEQRVCMPLISRDRREKTHALLRNHIKKAGQPKRSVFSYKMLGLWTHTAEFSPPAAPIEWRFMHLRHMSMVVPVVDRSSVQAHFEDQLRIFGADALIGCSERYEMVDFEDLRGSEHEKLLYQNIATTNLEDRLWLYDEVLKYRSIESLVQLGIHLDIRFAARGLFDIAPAPTRFSPFIDAERYADVLRFRARVAVSVCPLPQIEKLALRVNDVDLHVGEFPPNLQSELSTMLFARLEQMRWIIDFELPSQK